MADVGLNSDLVLDITEALKNVDTLEAAVAKATDGVVLNLDTSSVAQAIEDAVAAVTPVLPIDADTSTIPLAIDEAVAAADSTVPVAADTGALTSEIDSAIAGTDATITVDADTAPAQDAIDQLGAKAASSSSEVGGLEGVTAAFGATAGVAQGEAAGLTEAISGLSGEAAVGVGALAALTGATGEFFSAGLDAASASFRIQQALGGLADQADRINVGNLNTTVEELGTKLGSTGAAINNVQANLVNLGVAAGATQEQALGTANTFVALAARSVALNPALGNVEDVTQRLSTALARGGRFAQNYGITLTSLQIQQQALHETGKANVSDLTNYEKAVAGATLATAQFGGTLQQVIDQGAQNPALQLRSVKAEFQSFIETVGTPIVSPILDILKQTEPIAEQVARGVGDLVKELLPLVAEVLPAVGAGLGGVVQAFQILVPILTVAADIIGAIPAPLIALVATFLTARAIIIPLAEFALPLLASAFTAVGVTGVAAAIGFEAVGVAAETAAVEVETASFAIEASNPILLAVAAGIAIFTTVLGQNAAKEREHKQAVEAATAALADNTKSVQDNIDVLLKQQHTIPGLDKALNDAGVSYDDFSKAIIAGGRTLDGQLDSIAAAKSGLAKFGLTVDDLKKSNTQLAFETGQSDGAIQAARSGFEAARQDVDHYSKAIVEGAQHTLDAAVAQGKLTQADVDAALATAGKADNLPNYARALDALQPKLKLTEDATQKQADADQAAKKAADDHTAAVAAQEAAMAKLAGTAPSVTNAISALSNVTGSQVSNLTDLAVAVDSASLSQEQMQAVADSLGVSLSSLQQFVGDTTKAIQDFTDSALKNLPTAADIVGNVQSAADAALQAAQTRATAVEAAQKRADSAAQGVVDAQDRVDQANARAADAAAKGGSSAQSAADAAANAGDSLVKAQQSAADANAAVADAATGSAAKLRAAFDPQALEDALQANIDSITSFSDNLTFFATSGFDRLAQLAAQKGPEFASQLRTSIENDPGVGPALESKLNEGAQVLATFTAHVKNDLGPQIVDALGITAASAAKAFGDRFVLRDLTAEELQRAQLVAELSNIPLSQAIAVVGRDASATFKTNTTFAPAVNAAIADANTAITTDTSTKAAAGGLGSDATTGFGSSVDFATGGSAAIAGLNQVLTGDSTIEVHFAAFNIGKGIGEAFINGVTGGLREPEKLTDLSSAIADMVHSAETAARNAAGIHSPSRLFADIGGLLMEGLTEGIAGGTPQVVAQVQRSIDAVAKATAVPIAQVQPVVPAAFTPSQVGTPGVTPVVGAGVTLAFAEHAIDARGTSAVEVYDQWVTRSRNDLARLAVQTG